MILKPDIGLGIMLFALLLFPLSLIWFPGWWGTSWPPKKSILGFYEAENKPLSASRPARFAAGAGSVHGLVFPRRLADCAHPDLARMSRKYVRAKPGWPSRTFGQYVSAKFRWHSRKTPARIRGGQAWLAFT